MHARFQRVAVALAAAIVAIAGCAAQGSPSSGNPQIWDLRAGRFITEDQLVARLVGARYRLLGEVHDNAEPHRLRAGLIRRIAANGLRPAVVFEQFGLERDAALIAAQGAQPGGNADPDSVAAAGGIVGKAWQWPLHKPLVEAALMERLPLRAGNPERAELMRAARAPAGSVPDTRWGKRFASTPWSPQQDAILRTDIVDGHCGKLPEQATAAIVRAQRMRDAALAQALVDSATGDGAILIAGNGHVQHDVAVPVYLRADGDPAGAAISVGFIEAAPADRQSVDFPRAFLGPRPAYDVAWFTTVTPRGDPCAQMPAAPPADNK